MFENIPDSLKSDRKWVCCRSTSKLPLRSDMVLTASLAPYGYVSYEDMCASVQDPETWGTFDDALYNVKKNICSHVGYVFDGNGVIGVDLDHCFERGVLNEKSMEIINRFKSYTEISKSGEGIHILVKGKLPFTGSNNRNGVEVYSTKRFFILTGRSVGYDEVIENQEAIDWLIKEHFAHIKPVKNKGVMKAYKPPLYQTEIRLVGDTRLEIRRPKIAQGSRNCTLLSYAGVLRSRGLSDAQISQKVNDMNEKNCVPPLSKEEVSLIMRSIMKYSCEVERHG